MELLHVAFLVANVERFFIPGFSRHSDFWKEWSSDLSGCCMNKVWVVCSPVPQTVEYFNKEPLLTFIYFPLAGWDKDTPKLWIDLHGHCLTHLYMNQKVVDNDLPEPSGESSKPQFFPTEIQNPKKHTHTNMFQKIINQPHNPDFYDLHVFFPSWDRSKKNIPPPPVIKSCPRRKPRAWESSCFGAFLASL